jgi:hypothetical protein
MATATAPPVQENLFKEGVNVRPSINPPADDQRIIQAEQPVEVINHAQGFVGGIMRHMTPIMERLMTILREDPSDATTAMYYSICTISKDLYGDYLRRFIEAFKADPIKAMIIDRPKNEAGDPIIRCETITKALFVMMVFQDEFTIDQTVTSMKAILQEFIGRMIHSTSTNLSTWFVMNETESKFITPTFMKTYQEFLGMAPDETILAKCLLPTQLKRVFKAVSGSYNYFPKTYGDKPGDTVISFTLNQEKLMELVPNRKTGQIFFDDIQEVSKRILPEDIYKNYNKQIVNDDSIKQMVFHACSNNSSMRCCDNPAIEWVAAEKIIEKRLIYNFNSQLISNYVTDLTNQATQDWNTQYEKIHCMQESIVQSISKDELQKITDENKQNIEDYGWNPESGLCRNACQAMGCPHYMIPTRSFPDHMAPMIVHKNSAPGFHKGVYMWTIEQKKKGNDVSKMEDGAICAGIREYLITESKSYLKEGVEVTRSIIDAQKDSFILDVARNMDF